MDWPVESGTRFGIDVTTSTCSGTLFDEKLAAINQLTDGSRAPVRIEYSQELKIGTKKKKKMILSCTVVQEVSENF